MTMEFYELHYSKIWNFKCSRKKKCSAKIIVYKSMCVQLILSGLFALFCIQSEAH